MFDTTKKPYSNYGFSYFSPRNFFLPRPRQCIPLMPIIGGKIVAPPTEARAPFIPFPLSPRKRAGHAPGDLRPPYKPRTLSKKASLRPLRMHRSGRLRRPNDHSFVKHPRHKLRRNRSLKFDDLTREVKRIIKPTTYMQKEDHIFLEQMAKLDINRAFKVELAAARDAFDRAVEPAMHKQREEKNELRRVLREQEAQELEDKRLREECKRMEMLVKEEKLRRALRAEEERRAQEKAREIEVNRQRMAAFREELRREQLLMERLAREKAARDEREHANPKEAQVRLKRELEQNRMTEAASLQASQQPAFDPFSLYDAKWEALKSNIDVPPLHFHQLPWPIACEVLHPDQITFPNVQEFVFHPSRHSLEGKTKKERIRAEMLRWHPDKFDVKILGMVIPQHHEPVLDAAGRVARFLNQMLNALDAEVPA